LRANGVGSDAPLLGVAGSNVWGALLDGPAGTFDADGKVRGPGLGRVDRRRRRHGGDWKGSTTALLAGIDKNRPEDFRAPWPTSPTSLGAAIRKGQETLRAAGLVITEGKSNGARWVRLVASPEAPDLADDAA
jgi:hypothetical protein